MGEVIVTDNLTPENIKGTSLALGFFDGVHTAHQKVLRSALDYAKANGVKSVVITFKNHPMEILYGLRGDFVTTPEERIEIFKKMGFDVIIMPEFTKEIGNTPAEDYLNNVLMNLEPKAISIGFNHKFGDKKIGDAELLKANAEKLGYELFVIDKVNNRNAATISTTFIKGLVKAGDIHEANLYMFQKYSVKGKVIHGMCRGHLLGVPTANIKFPVRKLVPKHGVYVGYTIMGGKKYPSVANVGVNPTFGDVEKPLVEIHIFNFNQSIYNEIVEFEFLKKLRDENRFSGPDELFKQIQIDKKQAIMYFKENN